MTNTNDKPRVLITGGGTFLGNTIAAALVAEGAEVTLLVRPGAEDRVGSIGTRARVYTADVWGPASLKGRARGHQHVIHTVGSLRANPAQGLSYQWLNFISARNVANMCIGSGVPHMVLLSTTRAPWINRQYITAKRDAEAYLARVGLKATIIRAPLAYERGRARSPFHVLLTALGAIPPFSWLGMGRTAPMPADVIARGVARLTLEPRTETKVFYARDLRKRNTREERRHGVGGLSTDTQPRNPLRMRLDDEAPFGWLPPEQE